MLIARDVVIFYGHELVKGTHKSTFEITKENFLSHKGDCILGIRSSKACSDLNPILRKALKNDNACVNLSFYVKEQTFNVVAHGSANLTLSDDKSMVVRTSNFKCPRTLAINASASALDFPRSLVKELKTNNCKGIMIIEVSGL